MATFFSQIKHTYAPKTEDSAKDDVDATTFLAATRESLALLGKFWCDCFSSLYTCLRGIYQACSWFSTLCHVDYFTICFLRTVTFLQISPNDTQLLFLSVWSRFKYCFHNAVQVHVFLDAPYSHSLKTESEQAKIHTCSLESFCSKKGQYLKCSQPAAAAEAVGWSEVITWPLCSTPAAL